MYELIFTFLVTTKAGLPGFHIERISQFKEVEECEKVKTSMIVSMDYLVREGKMLPGVFECKKPQR
jgi:hypothetical protein